MNAHEKFMKRMAEVKAEAKDREMDTAKTEVRKSDLRVVKHTGRPWGISWSDAPYALCIVDDSGKSIEGMAVWGLPKKMTVSQAWADFDYANEYEVIE